jgi:hypothetical protein
MSCKASNSWPKKTASCLRRPEQDEVRQLQRVAYCCVHDVCDVHRSHPESLLTWYRVTMMSDGVYLAKVMRCSWGNEEGNGYMMFVADENFRAKLPYSSACGSCSYHWLVSSHTDALYKSSDSQTSPVTCKNPAAAIDVQRP